ncbi:MAG: ThiF family adenylyltransferase [bacterium]|nr:ThiF family adenylyltransferase [bacterium]
MTKLERALKRKASVKIGFRPRIFDLSSDKQRKTLLGLFSKNSIRQVIDDYEEQLRELFAIENPSRVYLDNFDQEFQSYLAQLKKRSPLYQQGRWIYYPWLLTVVHLLKDRDFQRVRTARNRNLINEGEQKNFYNAVVGIGGLSVGNSVTLAIVLQGGASHIRIADHDRLALSNLNRIRAGVENLGQQKAEITAKQIYALNPYAKIEIFPDGLNTKNVKKFFAGPPKLDIVVDELDNIAVKFLIREQAKRNKIAVVMGADNGDNAVIDIERYDLNPKTKFFHGRLGNVSYKQLSRLDKFGIGKTITKYIGPENVTERMQKSLLEMGKTIVSWPQLGGAALINGSAVAYCVRKILNNQPLERNRSLISLDEKLTPDYYSPAQRSKRKKVAKNFKKIFGL